MRHLLGGMTLCFLCCLKVCTLTPEARCVVWCCYFCLDSGPCHGDSGGGLFVDVDTGSNQTVWTLAGVVSKGKISRDLVTEDKTNRTCDTSKPTVFTDIRKFSSWISDTILETSAATLIVPFMEKITTILRLEQLDGNIKVPFFERVFSSVSASLPEKEDKHVYNAQNTIGELHKVIKYIGMYISTSSFHFLICQYVNAYKYFLLF